MQTFNSGLACREGEGGCPVSKKGRPPPQSTVGRLGSRESAFTSLVPIPKPLQRDIHSDFHFFVNTNVLQSLSATTAGAGRRRGSGGGGRGASACGPAPRGTRAGPRGTRRDAIRPGHLLGPSWSSTSARDARRRQREPGRAAPGPRQPKTPSGNRKEQLKGWSLRLRG